MRADPEDAEVSHVATLLKNIWISTKAQLLKAEGAKLTAIVASGLGAKNSALEAIRAYGVAMSPWSEAEAASRMAKFEKEMEEIYSNESAFPKLKFTPKEVKKAIQEKKPRTIKNSGKPGIRF